MIAIHAGDMREHLVRLAAEGVLFDSCCVDPPYHLASIVERFGAANAAPAIAGQTGAYVRSSRGFMGQTWDGGDIAFQVETWRLVYDVMKPGAHLVAFAATKNYHRLAVAIEDAGFEVRDMLDWAYGTGFAKNHEQGKAIDRHLGVTRTVIGQETINNDMRAGGLLDAEHGARPAFERDVTIATSPEAQEWDDFGTALKPCKEPICLARKPLSEKSVAANLLKWRTGALNIGACRIPAGDDRPRHPGNIIHDDSADVHSVFPDAPGQKGNVTGLEPSASTGQIYGDYKVRAASEMRGDSGSAARYFYSAKASKWDRIRTSHPTVKPVELMRWLTRLITPPGGRVLDCFAGTGTTGAGAMLEGFDCDLIELNPDYLRDIERRFQFMRGEGAHSMMETVNFDDPTIAAKAAGRDLPLFS